MPADNSRHLRAAARRRSEQTRQRAIKALRRSVGKINKKLLRGQYADAYTESAGR